MRQYRIIAGIIISMLISVLAAFPRIVRFEDAGQISGNIIYAFLLSLLYWAIHHAFILSSYWKTPGNRWKIVVASMLISMMVSYVFHLLLAPAFKPNIILAATSVEQRIILLGFRSLILSGLLFFIIYWMDLLTETQRSRTEIERLQKETLQAKLASLKQQISPHFLFNTLNTLNSLTKEVAVKDYIDKFSNVYRYLLSHKDYDTVELRDEMQFVNSYLYILTERFEAGLDVKVFVDGRVMKRFIPPLAIQTLIENAIKHNVVSSAKPLRMLIYNEDDAIIVKNNLQPRHSVENSFGQGLSNLQERYRLVGGVDLSVQKTNEEFIVTLPLI